MSLQISVRLDRAACILAGSTRHGEAILTIADDELAALSDVERARLADASRAFRSAGGIINLARPEFRHASYPSLVTADLDAIRQVLAACETERQIAEAKAREAEANRQAQWDNAQRRWLAKPLADLIRRPSGSDQHWVQPTLTGPAGEAIQPNGHADWPWTGADWKGQPMLPEVAARLDEGKALLAQVAAEVEQANADRKARIEAAEAKRKADETAKEAAKGAALAACLAAHGTENQRRRQARGLLSEDELLGLYRDQLFGPLDQFVRYQRITAEEVRATDPSEWGAEVEFTTDDDVLASAEEFDTLDAIERVAKTLPGEVTVTLRKHHASFKSDDDWGRVTRTSVLVTSENPVRVSREYACP